MTRIAFFSLLAALLCVSAFTARYAASDFYYEKAQTSYHALNLEALDSAKPLAAIIDMLDKALDWRSSHADAIDLKADLLFQSWWLSPDGQYVHQSNLLQRAATLHLSSLEYRKDWVYSAARLAMIYSNQPELDKNFSYWFLKSHKLGLYETDVAKSLMHVGLTNWPRLNESQRSMTIDFVRTSIEQKSNSPNSMRQVLTGYAKLDYVCESIKLTSRAKEVCNSTN